MNLLVFKEHLKGIYQKSENYIKPIIKFILSFIVFYLINHALGYDERLGKITVVLVLSLIGALTPTSILVLMAALLAILHVYFISKILSVITILILFVLYFLFIRFTPKQGIVVLIIPILFLLKIPYVVPILLAIMYTPIMIVPVSCGVIVYFFFQVINEVALTNTGAGLDDTLQLYTYVMNGLMQNKLLILTIIVFALVIIVTYIVRRKNFDHAFDIAIIAGATTNILGFLIGDLRLDISDQIVSMILGTIISIILVYIIQFFRLTLDYTAVENVQFEDDDYYYYVKAVPKINVTTPKKSVKRINSQIVTENTMNMKDTIKNKKVDLEIYEDDEEYDYDDEEYGTIKKDKRD